MKYFLCALTFLTRIPVGTNNIYEQDDFQKSVYFFPIIGLIIGGILGGSYYLLAKIFPQPVSAALLLLIYVFITGGLHLDGLTDTVDGIYGGRDREDRLRIMKDTHPGAFGVIAAVLVLLLKYSLYTQLDLKLLFYLFAAPVLGRQAMVWLQIIFPYARKEGLGKLFTSYANLPLFAVTTGITLVILISLLKVAGLYLFLLTGIFSLLLAWYFSRMLGGLTGDTYGASCELTEIFALLIALLLV